MRIRAAIEGNLEEIMEQELEDATAGVAAGIEQAVHMLQMEFREQTSRAGLGVGLTKAWRRKFWRNKGLDAAGLVYHKTSRIILAHDRGGIIRAKNRKYMAIPTPEAIRMAKTKLGVGRFGKVTPGNWPKNLPPLRYVPRSGNLALLVVDEVRITKTGRISKAKRTKKGKLGRGASTLVAFILVRQIRLKKVLDLDRAKRKVQNRLPDLIGNEYKTTPIEINAPLRVTGRR